ncbi:uncharacterized protein LOC121288382 [Carcharodon carcharias]|uniref:uncharacterized protein LOC121288382 n=1 Tax=Carcharodon carcharias TaxID=13397 RepID=UPI001B7DFE3B|nr:uncharacterized protein LOC121288382 [Carcharodon carcharias]
MLARASWLLLLSSAGFLLASVQPDCGGVLLPSVTSRILLVTDSINGTTCSWILQAPSSATVELEVISYHTVPWTDTSCTSAYLAIKLGPTQKERRFCDSFRSIPEVGRKLVIRGKGPGVVTLRAAYGMKQGFTLRYSVLVPDVNHREIDTRALELRTLTPLSSSVWGEGKRVDLSKGEAVMFSTSTGQGQQIIPEYPSMSTVQGRPGPPWNHQSSWSPGHPKLPGHPSDQGLRTQAQLQPGEVPATKDSQSDSRTTFHLKSLGTQASPERSKTSQGPVTLKIAAVSDFNTSPQVNLASILLSPSPSSPSPSSPSGPGPSSPSPSGPVQVRSIIRHY